MIAFAIRHVNNIGNCSQTALLCHHKTLQFLHLLQIRLAIPYGHDVTEVRLCDCLRTEYERSDVAICFSAFLWGMVEDPRNGVKGSDRLRWMRGTLVRLFPLQSPVRFAAGSSFPQGKPKAQPSVRTDFLIATACLPMGPCLASVRRRSQHEVRVDSSPVFPLKLHFCAIKKQRK